MAKQNKGTCVFCEKAYAKGGMTRHLPSCAARQTAIAQAKGQDTQIFHLVVEGLYDPAYWLHLETPATITLKTLDEYLRDISLECCGHLSAFIINGLQYTQMFPDRMPYERSMNKKLGFIFAPGLDMEYVYDFGSSTELKIRVLSERVGPGLKRGVYQMARNEAPLFPCEICGKPATDVCVMCAWVC